MKKLLTLITFLPAFSAPLFAENPKPEDTPDVIEVPDSFKVPQDTGASGPLNQLEMALIQSSYDGELAEVETLVAKGANVNVQDKKKRTPLILAAYNGHTSVVEFLLGKEADINARDSGGRSALIYACKRSFNETAALLLENGADVNVQSRKKGITPLMLAAVAGNTEMVRMLLQNGADANLTDIFGRTAKLLAQKKGNSDVVELLPDPPVQQSKQ